MGNSTRFLSLLLVLVLIVPLFAQGNHEDDRIYDLVREKLANDVDVKGGGLDVTVKNGAVTLRGRVHDQKAREKAEKLTKKIKGVVSVTNELKLFGKRLRTVRRAAKLTQEEVAEKASLNAKYLGQIERGEKHPSFEAVMSLSRALKVSPEILFQVDHDESDEKVLRRRIDGLLRNCTVEQLRQLHRVMKVLVEP